MSKNLMIVESPSKGKTIAKYIGKDFRVLSSKGHIRDIEASERDAECSAFDCSPDCRLWSRD